MNSNFGTVTLIGSGELTDSMVKVHRSLLTRIGNSPKPVFLDTPAGFELNVNEISARAVEYFKRRFDVTLEVASFKSRSSATELQAEDALCKLRHANYIFAGPGSPSYALDNWCGSTVWNMVVTRWANGAHLVFASAAAISIGSSALPVYEIFKAGHAVRWMDGIDLLGWFGLKLAIVPHWNNTEGGTYDTRFCFMGEPRLKILEQQLGVGAAILGIDEHTVITFDPATQTCSIAGAGQVTWRYAGREQYFPSGTTLAFDQLRVASLGRLQDDASLASPTTAPPSEIQMITQYLEQLARAMQTSGDESDVHRKLIDHAHDAMHELAQGWRKSDSLMPDQTTGALVDLLVLTRTRLRAAKQFELADQVRDELAAMGILLEDSSAGTTWKHVGRKE
jgi:hypothetical protein